jgi:hypothetical protein
MRITIIVFACLLARNAHAEEDIIITLPATGTEIALGKAPIKIAAEVDMQVMRDRMQCMSGSCIYKCVVTQKHDEGGDPEVWESKPVKTPSCALPVQAQAKFRAGDAQMSVYFADPEASGPLWYMPTGNTVTFSGGGPVPHTPMEKFLAHRDTVWGPRVATASSQGTAITYREYIDRARRWKPLSTALSKVKRGVRGKPGSWDASYQDAWSKNAGGDLACPAKNTTALKDVKIQSGELRFQIQVDSKILAVKVPIDATGAIRGTMAIPKELQESAGFEAISITGAVENDDAVYSRDQVRFGRSVSIEVTPKAMPESGCAFRATATDYLESRECVRKGEAITGSAVVQSGFNSMDRCCRGLRANDNKAECQ